MTIEQIGIGAAPGDNTGDGLRTAMGKVNNNFSNSSHAASKLVGTATGRVLLSESAGLDNGETNWTSGNLNPNEFGGIGANQVVSIGYAATTTTATFPLHVSNLSAGSITVTSTFLVTDESGATLASGVIPALAISSNKVIIITVVGLIGLSEKDPLSLRTETASSKIKVNV